MGAPGARIVLFGRAGCHLCDDARLLVEEVAREAGTTWAEVDIDGPVNGPGDDHEGRDLVAEYGELVPVVEVDGVRQGYWRIDRVRLLRALAAEARTS